MSLTSSTNYFSEAVLDFVWRQWGQLGVFAAARTPDRWCQDPEALLVFSLEVARREPRIFDELLDWVQVNRDTLMVHRVRHLLSHGDAPPRGLVDAALARTGAQKLARPSVPAPGLEPVFPTLGIVLEPFDEVFQAHGYARPPFRGSGKSRKAPTDTAIALAFKLRAAFGATARSEALRYLLVRGGEASTVDVAEAAMMSRFGVQQTLDELASAGLIRRRLKGKRDFRWSAERQVLEAWLATADGQLPAWIGWPAIFRGLIEIWRWLHDPSRGAESPYVLASGAARLMRRVIPLFEGQGLAWLPRHPDEVPIATYLPTFQEDIAALAAILNGVPTSSSASVPEVVAHQDFVTRRVVEVEAGEIIGGIAPGPALGLRFRWEAFGSVSTNLSAIEVQDPLSLLVGRSRTKGKRLPDDDFGTFEGALAGDRTFTLERVLLTHYAMALGENRLKRIEVRHERARLTHVRGARPAWTRVILANLSFPRWPHATNGPGGSFNFDSLVLPSQAGRLGLTQLSRRPDLVALMLPWIPAEHEERRLVDDLTVLLSFLQGAQARRVAVERYDDAGILLEEAWFDPADRERKSKLEPIDWSQLDDPTGGSGAVSPATLSSLLEGFQAVRDELELPAVIGCLMAASRLPLQGDIALRALALRRLTACWTASMGRRSKKVLSVASALDAMGLPVGETERSIMTSTLAGLDDGSLLARFQDASSFDEGVTARGALATLANAAVLHVLGYQGPVVDHGRPGLPSLRLTGKARKG